MQKQILNMFKIKTATLSGIFFCLVLFSLLVVSVKAQGANVFLTGDIMTATNNTTGSGAWSDPVSGNPGEVIEFRIVAQNQTPGVTANNVNVTASLPSNPSTSISASGTVTGSSFTSASDTVTVNVLGGSRQGLAYITGHARIFSASCPSGCAAPDTVASGGVNVGNLGPGESAQVMFKAYITNVVTVVPTPTPTPVPTPTPTPAPTPTPTPAPAAGGNTNNNSNSNTNNNSQTQTQTNNQNVTVTQTQNAAAAPAAQVLGTTTLPKTGPAPIALASLGGMTLAGWRLRRYGQDKFEVASTWLKRTIDKA